MDSVLGSNPGELEFIGGGSVYQARYGAGL